MSQGNSFTNQCSSGAEHWGIAEWPESGVNGINTFYRKEPRTWISSIVWGCGTGVDDMRMITTHPQLEEASLEPPS